MLVLGIDPAMSTSRTCGASTSGRPRWRRSSASSAVLKLGACVASRSEVKQGTVRLEDAVAPAAMAAGLEPVFVLINDQRSRRPRTLGVSNNRVGTNTNRVVLLRKSGESPLRPGRRVVGGAKGAQIRLFEVPVRLHAMTRPAAEERQFARGTVEGMPVTPRRHAPLPERGGRRVHAPRTEHRLAYSAEVSRPVAASAPAVHG